jgi:serine phosphatase RsbU (regulator of sigma subunit)
MWNPFRIGGFERRLVVSFLLVSVIPVGLIAFISTRYFMKSVQLVSNPAVEQSFQNSMEIARDFSVKLEEDAGCVARRLAEVLGPAPGSTGDDVLSVLRSIGEETHVDFAAIYDLEGTTWRLRLSHPAHVSRIDTSMDADIRQVQAAGPESRAAAEPGAEPGRDPSAPPHGQDERVTYKDSDVIASGVRSGNSLIVAGFILKPGLADKIRGTGDDLSRYRAVGLYVRMLQRYIIIVTCVLVVAMAVSATLASRVIARRISQPITELAGATQKVAKGDLSCRVDAKARDEVLSLITGFNQMTQDLEENRRNLVAMAKREAQVARDFEIASQVQESLFPTAFPAIPGWQFAAMCKTARVVGGDYYDVFEVAPGKVLLAQGDVSGKGLGAALTMASIHAIVRSSHGAPDAAGSPGDLTASAAPAGPGQAARCVQSLGDMPVSEMPAMLIQRLNRYLLASRTPEMFVTLFLGLLDCESDTLWYVNCGHPPAMVLRSPEGIPRILDIGGTVLGLTPHVVYEVGKCKIEAGETLVLFSDGVTEAMSAGGEMFGEVRIGSVLGASREETAADTMQSILGAVEEFAAGTEQADDISILVLKRTR